MKNGVVKKTVYNELVEDVKAIQTTGTRDLVKKANYNTKINETEKNYWNTDHHAKYASIQEFNKLTSDNFAARLEQAKLAIRADIADFIKTTYFDDKLKKLNKNLLQIKQNMY